MNNSVTSAILSANQIHIPQSADTELVQLAEGHLLRATVQRVADEMALLNIGGKALMVQTDVPLQPQQRVILQVSQIGPEKISLQIVQQSTPADATDASGKLLSLPQSSLETLLSNWNLDPDPTNQTIAKALFAHSQTLNPDTIQDVRTIWQQLPALPSLSPETGGQAGNIEALVYLHTNRLPINSESMALATHLLNNSLPIAQRLTTLQTNLHTLQSQLQSTLQSTVQPAATSSTPAQPDPPPALANLLNTVNSALDMLHNLSISKDMPSQQIAVRLAQVVTRLGTPPESELANRPTSNPTTPQPQPANGGGERGSAPVNTANSNGTAPQPASQLQPATASTATQPAADSGAKMATPSPNGASAPPAPADNIAPLHRLAAAITEAASHPNLNETTAHALRELSGQLAAVAKDLGAVQLSNLSNLPNPVTEPYFMFPVPMHVSDGSHTAQLRVYRRGHSSQPIDPDNLRLALLLDLPELGEIAIDLSVFERHLNGKIISGREQTHRLVETELHTLYHNLNKLGYRVDSLRADRLPAHKASIFGSAVPVEQVEIPTAQINITA